MKIKLKKLAFNIAITYTALIACTLAIGLVALDYFDDNNSK